LKSWSVAPFRAAFSSARKLGWTFVIREFYFAAMQHTQSFRNHFSTLAGLLLAVLGTTAIPLPAQTTNADAASAAAAALPPIPVLQIKADQVIAQVSPVLYGLMTEEINFSYEGGIYGELVRNRTFKANRDERGLLERRQRRNDFARHEPAAQFGAEREFETGLERGVKEYAGGNCQRRLLGNSRAAEHDLSRVVLCQG
jgi:hypothetical protein